MPVVIKPKQQQFSHSLSEMRRVAVWRRWGAWGMILIPFSLIVAAGIMLEMGIIKDGDRITPLQFAVVCVAFAVLCVISIGLPLLSLRKKKEWDTSLKMLCLSESTGAIGGLLDAVCSIQLDADPTGLGKRDKVSPHEFEKPDETLLFPEPERITEQDVWEALIRLLSCVEPDDAAQLNADQREILRAILRRDKIYVAVLDWYDREKSRIHHAIVGAMKVVGDSRDLPTLRDMASGKISEIAVTVRREAEEAISLITARMGTEAQRQELLRASQVRRSDDQLLRPAAGGQTQPENELLRAGVERN